MIVGESEAGDTVGTFVGSALVGIFDGEFVGDPDSVGDPVGVTEGLRVMGSTIASKDVTGILIPSTITSNVIPRRLICAAIDSALPMETFPSGLNSIATIVD